MIQHIIITLPMFVCGIISAELCLDLWQKPDHPRRWLLWWSATATVLYATHYVYFSHATWLLPITDSIYAGTNLAVYPLYLIYIYALTERLPSAVRYIQTGILLSMAVICAVIVRVLYLQMSPDELHQFLEGYLYHTTDIPLTGWAAVQAWVHDVERGLFLLTVMLTVVLGTRRIQRYNKFVVQLYADTEEKTLHRITIILYLLVIVGGLSIMVNFLGRHYFVSSAWLALPSLAFSALLFLIGHIGIHQHFSIDDVARDEKRSTTTGDTEEEMQPETFGSAPSWSPDSSDTSSLTERLRKLIEGERLFLQPNLKLDDVARRLHTNRTYLLRAMKNDLQMTFSEYINRQRIAYACALMERHPKLDRSEVAERAGYSSLSAFYRNLKEYGESEK